jgi:hypothetical protein
MLLDAGVEHVVDFAERLLTTLRRAEP